MLYPAVAWRDCRHCQKYSYDEQTGLVNVFHGQPLERDRGEPPPCRTTAGCAKGTPEDSRALTPSNWLCYEHYRKCKAVGRFPLDELVAHHAAVIAEVEREAWETKQLQTLRTTISTLASMNRPSA